MVFQKGVKIKKTQNVVIYIWPKICGIKRFYLYTSKGRQFGRMEEIEREDGSERYKNIKSN